MKQSNIPFILFLLIVQFSLTLNLHLLKKKNFSYAHKSNIAMKRIKNRLHALKDDTSCKVAAKFVLLTISDIRAEEDRTSLALVDDVDTNIKKIKELLKEGYVIQIEIKTNHHFVLIQKNPDEMYLLQAFYKFYRLKDWLSHDELVTVNIDKFFDMLKFVMNPNNDLEKRNKVILDLFYPFQLSQGNQEKIDEMLKYFNHNPCVTFVHVDYVNYDFSVKEKGRKFDVLFDDVVRHFTIY